jgi:hypothetical protein
MNATDLMLGIKQLLVDKPGLLEHISPSYAKKLEEDKVAVADEVREKRRLDAPLRNNTDTTSNLVSALISPETVLGVASGGASIPMQTALQAGMGGVRAAESGSERGMNALTAGVGNLIGAGATKLVGKGVNAVRGKWADPAKKALSDTAEARGVTLSAGDLGNGPARVAEDFLGKVPFTGRQGKLQAQGTRLSEMLQDDAAKLAPASIKSGAYQDGHEGHLLADQLLETYAQKKAANNVAWRALDIYMGATGGIIPPVRPNNLVNELGPFMNKYGKQIRGMTNEDASRKLIAMATKPGEAIDAGTNFGELQELQSALGDLVGQAKRQALSGATSGNLSGAVQQLYKAAQNDIENWGQTTAAAGRINPAVAGLVDKAVNLYRTATIDFKTNVLPYRQTPVVKDLINGSIPDSVNGGWLEYGVDPNAIMKAVIKPGQNQLLRNVFDLVPPEGQQALKYSLFKMKSDPTFNPDTGDVRPLAFQAKNKMLKPAGEAIYTPGEQATIHDTIDILGAADRARVNIDEPKVNGLGTYVLGGMAMTNPLAIAGALGGANAATTGLASKAGRNFVMAEGKPFTGSGKVTGPLSRMANTLPSYLTAQGVRRATENLMDDSDQSRL